MRHEASIWAFEDGRGRDFELPLRLLPAISHVELRRTAAGVQGPGFHLLEERVLDATRWLTLLKHPAATQVWTSPDPAHQPCEIWTAGDDLDHAINGAVRLISGAKTLISLERAGPLLWRPAPSGVLLCKVLEHLVGFEGRRRTLTGNCFTVGSVRWAEISLI